MACNCTICNTCDGDGIVWFSFSGKYLGKYRCDDLDEYDTCEDCSGEGISSVCDECREREYELMLEEEY